MNTLVHQYTVSPEAVGELLTGAGEFLTPQELLGDLTEAQAMAAPAGSLYSIGRIVAHMQFWQERGSARAQGQKPARPEHLDDTFPVLQAGEWDDLRASFLAGLELCAQAAAEHGTKTSADRAGSDIAYDLAQCPALHNAYHFGQVALLRQIQGFWPPAGGDGSW
ncbi:MAG: DinB family protein [Janthinobacterium lividum]